MLVSIRSFPFALVLFVSALLVTGVPDSTMADEADDAYRDFMDASGISESFEPIVAAYQTQLIPQVVVACY